MERRVWEIIRVIIVSFVGAALVFLVQPWLYQAGILPLTDVDVEIWIAEKYTPGAAIVFTISLAANFLWYVIASKVKIQGASDVSRLALVWWLLLLLPILAICAALYFFNDSNDALLFLTVFYILDVLLVYWFSTAISSPGLLKTALPGSFFLRHLLRLR